jgi:hypothetical protein
MEEKYELNLVNPIQHGVVINSSFTLNFFSIIVLFLAGLRIDYLDRPTARRFVIVRPQDNTTKRRTSRSSSASSASSTHSGSSKGRVRSVSNDDPPETTTNKISKRQSHSRSPSPPPTKRRSLSPPVVGHTFYGPYGSYLSPDDTTNINNISDLMTLCEKLNVSASKTNAGTAYSVQFILKSHAYDARMHFLAGSPNIANAVLGKFYQNICLFLKIFILSGQPSNNKTELKVTQRLRLDQHKLDDLEKKLRTSVTNALSNTNLNGQSTPTGGRKQTNPVNQTKFAILITSPKTSQRKSNGKANSPNHPLSSDENDDRSQAKTDAEADDESSLSRLISYLAA